MPDAEGKVILEIRALEARRGRFRVAVSGLALGRGSVVLAGPNGSGKSTLLAALAGLLPSRGAACLEGTPLWSAAAQARIAYLPQDPSGLEHLRLADALRYAEGLCGRDGPAPDPAPMLGIAHLLDRPIGRLSGGERRLAYLAVSLVHEPALILLDEPTTGIDAGHRTAIRAAIRRLARGSLVLTASHLPEDVEQLGERILVMRAGRVVFDGPLRSLRALAPRARREGATPIEAALVHLEAADA